jgi:hypothetical protein
MKHVKRTTAEKKKEKAKPRNHPRSKSEKIEIKRPMPNQDQAKISEILDTRVTNANQPGQKKEDL